MTQDKFLILMIVATFLGFVCSASSNSFGGTTAHVSIDHSAVEIEFEPTFSVVALSDEMEVEFIAVK